jgi:CHAT domain-containing protein/Flp pilus assembly protein TadD
MLRPSTTLIPLAILLTSAALSAAARNSAQITFSSPTSATSHSAPHILLLASRQTEADRHLEQGINQWRTAQLSESLQSLQQALTIYQELNDQPKQVKTLRNLGNVHHLLANYDQAIAYYQQSRELARRIGDREGEAGALGNLGVVAAGRGDYRKAREYYQQALPIYQQIRDRLGEGQTAGNLAEVAYGEGNYPQAIAYLQKALAIARELKDHQLEANTIGLLGVVYYSTNDYPKSIQYHQQHLTLARRLKDRRGEAAAMNNLGNTYYALGDYGKAIEYLEQRLILARETQDRLGEAQALKNLANIYHDLGNYNRAIEYAFKGLTIAQEIKNPSTEASILTSLGNLYLVAQDYPKAIEYHQRRLAIARAMNDPNGVGTALINLGNVHKTIGQYPQAIEFHQQALEISRKIQDRGQESSALVNLGIEYDDLEQYAKAIAYHQQALAIVRTIKDLPTEGLILNNLGNSLFRSGNLADAEATLLAGVKVWESLRQNLGSNDSNKVSIFDQQARTYRLLQRVLVAQNKTDTALEIAERGRARAFVELLSRKLIGNRQGTISKGQQQNPPLALHPAPTLAQIKQIAKAENSTLVQYSITYEDVLIKGKVEARETELYIWAIAPSGTITFRRVDLKPLWQKQKTALNDLVAINREGIGVRGRGLGVVARTDAEKTSNQQNQLYQLLIQPIANALPQDPDARVTFIPQGPLFLVPFAALQNPSGRYLIEQHTILTAPSIQVLELTRQQKVRSEGSGAREAEKSPYPALVVGNPTMPKLPARFNQPAERLEPLPGAEQEANEIAPLLGTKAITGNRATKSTIVQLMPQQRIIHLATHGLLDDFKGSGVPGAIALAPDPPTRGITASESGLLTADEILDLKLTAELVVLSACDTGRGRITGDGVIGLSRSFITAGVPSLIVSLWSVPDAPTASLMTAFYQNLRRNPDKAKALRQAMLSTLQQYPNPRDWAAFTLIGEAE